MSDLAPLLAFLDAYFVVHLATSGDGGPHGAPVVFARVGDGASLVWTSALHVLHSAMVAMQSDHRFWLFGPTWARHVNLLAGVSASREWKLAP